MENLSDADIDKAVEILGTKALKKEQVGEKVDKIARAAELEKMRVSLRELEKGMQDRLPGVLKKQAGQMLEIRGFSEPEDFDRAMEELVDRMESMLEPEVAAKHGKQEMRLLVEAAMQDALRKKIRDAQDAELPDETDEQAN